METRHEVYSHGLALLKLRREALSDLRRRGLSDGTIADVGFASVPLLGTEHQEFMRCIRERFDDDTLRLCPGFFDKNGRLTFWSAQGNRDGYVVPYRDEHGRITGIQQKRFDGGYRSPFGAQLDSVYCIAGNPLPGCDLYLTEGGIKAIVSHELLGSVVFAVAGQALMRAHVETIRRLQPSRVVVCLDRENNLNTDRARRRWLQDLASSGVQTFDGVWEGSDVGGPKGLDDLLQAGTRPRLRRFTAIPAAIGTRRTPREIPVAGEIDKGMSISEARRMTANVIDAFVDDLEDNRGRALLVHTPPGTAKTTAAAKAIADAGARARITVGTTALAAELAGKFGYAYIEGRNEYNCERLDVVQALGADAHNVEALACGTEKKPRCPARDACLYWRQFDQVGTRVGAAEQLFNHAFLRGGNLVVVDDGDLLRSTIERHQITVETLKRAYDALKRRRREPARRVIAAVGRALLDAQLDDDLRLPLQGPAVWDHLVRTERRFNGDFVAAVEALPEDGTLPLPGDSELDVLTVESVEASVPGTMKILLDVLRDEVARFCAGEDFNSCLRLDKKGLRVLRMRKPATDRHGSPIVAELPLLVLEATPVPSLVDRLTERHHRLPDVTLTVSLPENVTVVQHASSSNSRTVLRDPERLETVLAEVAAERERFPSADPKKEAAICFRFVRDQVEALGFNSEQLLTFGGVRGLNVLSDVDRLHVIGRPMAPSDDLLHLAQVIHHEESAINPQLVVEPRRFGGQPYEVDVVDFEDERAAALLKATREDELVQVIHRARPYNLQGQGELFRSGRQAVRLVLYTGHPIPGLRVDELHLTAIRRDVNAERAADAESRVQAAIERLQDEGRVLSVNAIAKAARADKRTVTRAMGKPVDTLRGDLNKGVHHLPRSSSHDLEAAVADGLCAGCGIDVPRGHRKCADCAASAVAHWKKVRRTG